MMDLFPIASGSSGNCICAGDDHTHVMLDAGISGKRIEEGMNSFGYTTADMAGVLVTHEHSDHVSSLGVVSRKWGLPIYGTEKTLQAIRSMSSLGAIDPGLFHPITAGVDFNIGSLTISPVSVSHDAADPVAYRIASGNKSVAVLTDLGMYDQSIIGAMQGLDAMLIESNHDVDMLLVGPYYYELKQRVLSELGHLSNESCGQLLCQLLHDNMKKIYLGHLSAENNYPDLAYETVRMEITLGDNPYKGGDFDIEVAKRKEVSTRVEI